MGKVLRWLGVTVCGVAVLAIVIYGIARLRGPEKGERAALALLEASPEPPGRNAFAALWLMPYDVPEARHEDVMAEDVRRFARMKALPGSNEETLATFSSIAEERYPAANREADRSPYCKWREPGCLAKVRADPDAYARLLEADAALLTRAGAISRYGHVLSVFPPRLDMPFPPYSPLAYPLTQHAHAFVAGDADKALGGACRDISTARMLIGHGDNLISSMIGAAMLRGNAELFAEMLAEMPMDHPLPASCTAALAPATPDEFTACHAMRGEARFIFGTMREIGAAGTSTGSAWQNRLLPIFYDYDKTVARMAPRLAWYCGDDVRTAVAADIPTQAPPMPGAGFACADNVVGCILADVGSVSMDDYQHRLQDAGMYLKMASTILWLRDGSGSESPAERLAHRPPALRSPHRELRISEDGTSLSVDLFDTRSETRWRLPLPASRLQAARPAGSQAPGHATVDSP